MQFHEVSYTLIPRDTGSHDNDWVTDQFEFWSVPKTSTDWPCGPRRAMLLEIRMQVYDGSGVNTWTVTPVMVLDTDMPSDSRVFFVDERRSAVGICARSFVETELPLRRTYNLPIRQGAYALRLVRTGAGSNRLRVRFSVASGS